MGLLGPNGSGKSTTVKILCGLIRTFEGEARVDGVRLPDRGVARRLGYMPQQTALYTELSVHENLDFYASINGVRPAAERKRRIDEMLGLLDLSAKRREAVEALSGGMRQRVSLAAALLHRPPILLLDEPTVGLDPELRLAFWEYFKRLAAEGVDHRDLHARLRRGEALQPPRVPEDGTAGRLRDHRGAAGEGRSRGRRRLGGGVPRPRRADAVTASRRRQPNPHRGHGRLLVNALYVARKIFRQFRRDTRTLALIFVVPAVVMTIYYFLLRDDLAMKLTLAVISTERDSASYTAFAEVLGGQKNIGSSRTRGRRPRRRSPARVPTRRSRCPTGSSRRSRRTRNPGSRSASRARRAASRPR